MLKEKLERLKMGIFCRDLPFELAELKLWQILEMYWIFKASFV